MSRRLNKFNLLPAPAVAEIKQSRIDAGLTQGEAAAMIGTDNYRTWQNWESGTNAMPVTTWNLWLLLIGKHPDFKMTRSPEA